MLMALNDSISEKTDLVEKSKNNLIENGNCIEENV